MRQFDYNNIVNSLLDSTLIKKNSRQHHLLSLLLSHMASGAQPLTERQIRRFIWQKDDDPDVSSSSIVRTEMYRLRQKLSRFNRRFGERYGFHIEIVPRSYELSITPLKPAAPKPAAPKLAIAGASKFNLRGFVKKPELGPASLLTGQKHKLGYASAWKLVVIISLLVFGCVFYVFRLQDTNGSEIVHILPTFKLANDFTDNNVAHRHFGDIEKYFLLNFSPLDMVRYKTEGPTDYTLRFKEIDGPLTTRDSLTAQLYEEQGNLIWTKTYRVSHTPDGLPDFHQAVDLLVEDLFWISGIIPALHTRSSKLSEAARHIYHCLRDMSAYWDTGAVTHFESPLELIKCSETSVKLDPQAQASLHLFRSRIFRHGLNGYIDLGMSREEALSRAVHDLEKVRIAGNMDAAHYNELLLIERDRLPMRDTDRLNEIIKASLERHPDDLQILTTIASIQGAFMGEWEQAHKIFETLESEISSPHHIYYLKLSTALAWDDPNMVRDAMSKVAMSKQPSLDVWLAAGACYLLDEKEIRNMRKRLTDHNIETHDQYSDFIQSRRLDPNFAKTLISIMQPIDCPLFVE